ncbi:TAP-like protein-domain-containing protein [Daedaleopsis nitida]|nr:TAP-like protein-domain-containing protein [Daedaleopsis nitida]
MSKEVYKSHPVSEQDGVESKEQDDSECSPDDFDWEALQPSRTIMWTPCYSAQKCARLLLPLDYDIPDGPTTAIAIRMIPATDADNYRGTIFLNPGGPGPSGVDLISRRGQSISRITGPSFDVLSFDPRGIGRTTPAATCFDSDSQSKIWLTQGGHRFMNDSAEALGIYRARARMLAERTPNVAQDMLEMSRMLGQEQIQYWGFSYGTILGQYFASMYPDKIKRFVIDGDIVDSLFTFWHEAGPDKCPIYDSSPAKIRERYFHILNQVKEHPVPVPLANPPAVITYKALVAQFFSATYVPYLRFDGVAQTIRAIETNNQTALAALASQIVDPVECQCDPKDSPLAPLLTVTAFSVVECGDVGRPAFDPAAFAALYRTLADVSPLFAPLWAESGAGHARSLPPRTSHPLLLVSTRYDPVTPLAQAPAVARRFGGAALLTQESHGHCSNSAPSLCTARHIRAYFVDGTLPEEGATCEVDELPFVGKRGAVRALTAEDEELLEAMRDLAGLGGMPVFPRL